MTKIQLTKLLTCCEFFSVWTQQNSKLAEVEVNGRSGQRIGLELTYSQLNELRKRSGTGGRPLIPTNLYSARGARPKVPHPTPAPPGLRKHNTASTGTTLHVVAMIAHFNCQIIYTDTNTQFCFDHRLLNIAWHNNGNAMFGDNC